MPDILDEPESELMKVVATTSPSLATVIGLLLLGMAILIAKLPDWAWNWTRVIHF